MTIEIRQVSHPEAVKGFDTAELRRHFLIETLFAAGEIRLTYSHLDRVIVGGAMPTGKAVVLPTPKAVGTDAFLKRRELGIVNVGGPGKVSVGGRITLSPSATRSISARKQARSPSPATMLRIRLSSTCSRPRPMRCIRPE